MVLATRLPIAFVAAALLLLVAQLVSLSTATIPFRATVPLTACLDQSSLDVPIDASGFTYGGISSPLVNIIEASFTFRKFDDGALAVTERSCVQTSCSTPDAGGVVFNSEIGLTLTAVGGAVTANVIPLGCFLQDGTYTGVHTMTLADGGIRMCSRDYPSTATWAPFQLFGDTLRNLPARDVWRFRVIDGTQYDPLCPTELRLNIWAFLRVTATLVLRPSCFQGTNGNATVTVGGGLGTYRITELVAIESGRFVPPGYVGSTFTGSVTLLQLQGDTNYRVRVVDTADANSLGSLEFYVPHPPQLQASASPSAATCFSYATGQITLTITGGTSPYVYSVNGAPLVATALQTNTISGLAAGSYTIVVTDYNGCTASASAVVTQPNKLRATASHGDVACLGGSSGTISISITGQSTAPYRYVIGGTTVSGPTAATSASQGGYTAGSYTVRVLDANNCPFPDTGDASIDQVISGPMTAVTINTASVTTEVVCFGSSNGVISFTASGGTPPLRATLSGSAAVLNGPFSTPAQFTGLSFAMTRTLTVLDANNCQATSTLTMVQPPPLISMQISQRARSPCNGDALNSLDITVTLGNTGTYTVSRNSVTLFSSSTSGDTRTVGPYPAVQQTFVATDSRGCQVTQSFTPTEPAAVTVTLGTTQSPSCASGQGTSNDGSVSITNIGGGVGPYELFRDATSVVSSYSMSTYTFTGLAAGSYSFAVADQNGCRATVSQTVSATPLLTITGPTLTHVTCFGASTGSAVFTFSRAASSQLFTSPAGTSVGTRASQGSATYNSLPSGSYTLTATAGACQASTTPFTINTNPAITFLATPVSSPCPTNSPTTPKGSITVSMFAGGSGSGYVMSLDMDSFSGSSRSNLNPGTYAVRVRDSLSCISTTQTITVSGPTNFNVGTSATGASCFNSNDGSVTVATITGGTGSYTVRIDSGTAVAWSSSTTYQPLASGSRTVTVTDSNNCQFSQSQNVPNGVQVLFTATPDEDRCPTGTGTILVSSTQANNRLVSLNPLSLAPGALPVTATSVRAGTYTAVVSNSGGTCTNNAMVTVPLGVFPSLSWTDNTCSGDTSGSVRVCAAGGYPPYQVTFDVPPSCSAPTPSPLQLTQAQPCGRVSNLQFGCTYTADLTDNRGCFIDNSITLTVSSAPAPVNIMATITDPSCPGTSTGSVQATVSGGATPYQSIGITPTVAGFTNLTNQASGAMLLASGMSGGSYTLVVTDANNCPHLRPLVLTSPPTISLSLTPSPPSCPTGGTGTTNDGQISVSATGGTGAITFSRGGTGFTSPLTGLTPGSYTIVGTDSRGCQASSTTTVPSRTPIAVVVTASTNPRCPDPSDPQYSSGSITVSVTGGTGTYTSISLIDSLTMTLVGTPATASPATFPNLPPRAFDVVVVDSNSCTRTFSTVRTLSAPTSFAYTATDNSCTYRSFLAITATGGTGALTVQVTPAVGMATTVVAPPASFADLPFATDLTLRITDSRGCFVDRLLPFQLATVTGDLTVNVMDGSIACFGGTTSATLTLSGGTAPYTLGQRRQPTLTYTNTNSVPAGTVTRSLTAGTWEFTLTDARGCVMPSPSAATFSEPAAPLSLAPSSTNPTCSGDSNGVFSVTPSGGTAPYTASPAMSRTMLAAGSYTITVTDNNGCTSSQSRTLTNPTRPTATLTRANNPTCIGSTNGALTLSVSSGQGAPYTFTLTNGGGMFIVGPTPQVVTSPINNLPAGSYTATGYDQAGCPQVSSTVTLTEVAANLAMTTSSTNVRCNGGSDGTITVSASGGLAPYTISRGAGAPFTNVAANSAQTFTNLASGTYTITVTDANSCFITSSVTVSQPAVLAVTPSFAQPLCVETLTSVTINVAGGTAGFTTVMSGSASGSRTGTSPTFTNLGLGSYTFTTTDSRGCIASTNVVLSVASPLTISVADRTCFGDATGRVFVRPSGGAPMPDYRVTVSGVSGSSTVPTTGATLNAPANTAVTVTAFDSNNCQAQTVITPTRPTVAISGGVSSTPSACHIGNGLDNGVITLSLSGGTGPYTGTLSPDPTSVGQVTSSGGVLTFNNVPGNDMNIPTTVQVLDRNQCPFSISVVVSSPPALAVLLNEKTRVICNGDATASLESQLTGGNGRPYSITAITGGPDPVPLPLGLSIPNLKGGSYTVSYRDSRGCTTSANYVITNPPIFRAPVSLSQPITCFNNADGVITLTISGGEPPYYLRIEPPPTQPYPPVITMPGVYQLRGLTEADYSIYIRDDRACEVPYQGISLTQPGFLEIIKPAARDEFFMYRPYEILYRYTGGMRDQLVNIDLFGPRNLRYSIARLQSANAFNGIVQVTIPHHIIPGKYRLRVGNELCIDAYTGEYVIHASRETLQRTQFQRGVMELPDTNSTVVDTTENGGRGQLQTMGPSQM